MHAIFHIIIVQISKKDFLLLTYFEYYAIIKKIKRQLSHMLCKRLHTPLFLGGSLL